MTLKACVIGNPVSHSLSPNLHNYWLGQYQIDGHYEAVSLEGNEVEAFVKGLPESPYNGCNVTIPYKEKVVQYVDHYDDLVERIGAANTLYVKDGKVYATNTDGYGFIENLLAAVPGYDLKDKRVLVLGAGGAAKAIVVALLDQQVAALHILNRDVERAKNFAAGFDSSVISAGGLDSLVECMQNQKWDLIVNTTSNGLNGEMLFKVPLPKSQEALVVYDIVYNPLFTPMLSDAKAQGHDVVTGIGMLVYQAVPGFELWFSKRPQVDDAVMDMVCGLLV